MSKCAMRWAAVIVTVSVILSLGNTKHETIKGYSWFICQEEEMIKKEVYHRSRFLRSSDSAPAPAIAQSAAPAIAQSAAVPAIAQSAVVPATTLATELEYDFYRNKCPNAEGIVRSTVNHLFNQRVGVASALLRLHFHDCFVQGCDASVLLDPLPNGERTEKDASPNLRSLKGFDLIDIIKSKVEEECPATVSCADILALSARDAVTLAGGPYYPLSTGRRDSNESFAHIAEQELPNPFFNLSTTLDSFAKKGFNERDTVSLLGGHSVGTVHCRFFEARLYDFNGNGPDGTLDSDLREILKSLCSTMNSAINDEETAIPIDYNSNSSFDSEHYYQNLLKGYGVLYADQQLTSGGSSLRLVREYAMDSFSFRRDFARAMVKLSGLMLPSGSQGYVRLECSKMLADTTNQTPTPAPA